MMQWLDRFASHRLADVLRAKIISGMCPPGSRMPSYRQFRNAHGVALSPAQAAIRVLAAESLVEIRPVSGAFMRDSACGDDGLALRAEPANLRAGLR